jgi:hypothetical protein
MKLRGLRGARHVTLCGRREMLAVLYRVIEKSVHLMITVQVF